MIYYKSIFSAAAILVVGASTAEDNAAAPKRFLRKADHGKRRLVPVNVDELSKNPTPAPTRSPVSAPSESPSAEPTSATTTETTLGTTTPEYARCGEGCRPRWIVFMDFRESETTLVMFDSDKRSFFTIDYQHWEEPPDGWEGPWNVAERISVKETSSNSNLARDLCESYVLATSDAEDFDVETGSYPDMCFAHSEFHHADWWENPDFHRARMETKYDKATKDLHCDDDNGHTENGQTGRTATFYFPEDCGFAV